MLLVEILGVDATPLGGTPCGEVYAIGDVAYMVLLGIVALPDGCEHLLADPSMQHGYAIHLLTGVAGKGRHAELLRVVVGIGAAHADELVPRDSKLLRIAAHVLAKEALVEVVVAGRNRGVDGVEAAGTHQLQGLIERQMLFLDIVNQTLQVTQGCMALVAVIDVFLDAQLLQQQHAADA